MNIRGLRRSEGAFTLIELMAVLVIIGILSSMSMAIYRTYIASAYAAHADTALHNLKTALEAGKTDLASSQFYFGWSNASGPIMTWDGHNIVPGFQNSSKTLVNVWYDGQCDQGLWGNWCGIEGASVAVCKIGLWKSWFKWKDGLESTWTWQGAPWC